MVSGGIDVSFPFITDSTDAVDAMKQAAEAAGGTVVKAPAAGRRAI